MLKKGSSFIKPQHLLQDLNFETGGKLTGKVSHWERLLALSIQTPASAEADWFDKDLCASLVDLSKWNGDVNWSKLWGKTHGVIYRLGYGAVQDKRFADVAIPGFANAPDERYCALYHYMNTGVSKQAQSDLVLESITKMGGRVNAFWVDIEAAYNEESAGSYFSNPKAIMDAVRAEYPSMPVGFYTNGRGWNALNKLGNPKDWLEQYLFWYAWYPYNPTRYPKPPSGLGLNDIYVWQYLADGNGLGYEYGVSSFSVDINVTRDNIDKFLEDNVTGENPDPPPIPDDWNLALDAVQDAVELLRR
ncbi:MAG: GH25 family lysozyme [Euryarchaeota archaeon]|nr:GH25 family lysozyme [Euryarchaeota archaeon]